MQSHRLSSEDQLLFGIKGLPQQNKQLNRITDKICDCLNWRGEQRITPHGFRATIASLLDERGVNINDIKYLLGIVITIMSTITYVETNKKLIVYGWN